MLEIKEIYTEEELEQLMPREKYVDALNEHLGQFGDTKEAINNCVDYAFSTAEGKGGFLLAAYYEGNLAGELIINKTHTFGYIPHNILVYVAVDGTYRGKGFGRQICQRAIDLCDGDVKLHVEYDNPAKRLYERMGFTNKYAEMRYHKQKD